MDVQIGCVVGCAGEQCGDQREEEHEVRRTGVAEMRVDAADPVREDERSYSDGRWEQDGREVASRVRVDARLEALPVDDAEHRFWRRAQTSNENIDHKLCSQ